MDTVSVEQRKYNMSQIHGKDTKPEIIVRKYLFHKGLRYRKNDRKLSGSPDIVFPKYKTVVFINGCFWHGHENCKLSKLPETNTDFWKAKILSNKDRDKRTIDKLTSEGWNVIVIWQCELKKNLMSDTLENLYQRIIERQ